MYIEENGYVCFLVDWLPRAYWMSTPYHIPVHSCVWILCNINLQIVNYANWLSDLVILFDFIEIILISFIYIQRSSKYGASIIWNIPVSELVSLKWYSILLCPSYQPDLLKTCIHNIFLNNRNSLCHHENNTWPMKDK